MTHHAIITNKNILNNAMAPDTKLQIETINKHLSWVKKYRSEDYETRFLQLMEERRKLRRIAEAERENPAIAAYGESQKGKSYLIGNLLQKSQTPFMVKNENGEEIDFVDRVNPIGDKREATGVVTRFTSFSTSGTRYQTDHPVLVKLFNIGSLATILCDSYYHDIKDKQLYPDEEIKIIAEEKIYAKYKNQPESPHPALNAEDILDLKAYLTKYVSDAQGLLRSGYLDRLALVIDRVPYKEWGQVFKYLWHEEKAITSLFERLLDALKRLQFAHEVYVNFDAVMHFGDNKNTIMSVDCLNGLDDTTWSLTTNVYLFADGQNSVVNNFAKCELCALCAETVFKIDDEYLEDAMHYYYDSNHAGEPGYMSQDTYNKLKLPETEVTIGGQTVKAKQVRKDLLKNTDLLDFPGARNRLKVMRQFLMTFDNEIGASNLVQMFLRGKVAYLFNNYSENRIINILLYCHDNEQPNVNDMYSTLNDWVERYVGKSPEARARTENSCGGVAPLFVVCTKFNIDMTEKKSPDGNSSTALHGRWEGRFMKVLYTQCFKGKDVQWFKDWNGDNQPFKNTYLLRDFKYSGCDGSGNNLYRGFDVNIKGSKENELVLNPEFYNLLRETFATDDNVKMFFSDPNVAWDVAATMNNDGALHIIYKMTMVAKTIGTTRQSQFEDEKANISSEIHDIMKGYYIPNDLSEILSRNVDNAYSIFRDMEFTCQGQPEYFGQLISEMQMSESECFKIVHNLIPQLPFIVHDPKKIEDYELIRKRCNYFEGCEDDNQRWQRLIESYHYRNLEDANNDLTRKGIDPSKLFNPKALERKNSAVVAQHIIEEWLNYITGSQFTNLLAGDGRMDEITLGHLVERVTETADSVELQKQIANKVSEYTDVLNTSSINESLVADIAATTISDFVIDMGYSSLTDKQVENARANSKQMNLPCFDWIDRERKESYTEEEMTALFDDILTSSKQFPPSYDANYNSWLEHLFVASIAHVKMPEGYNREANDELKTNLYALTNQ